jgi:hypothetical protein
MKISPADDFFPLANPIQANHHQPHDTLPHFYPAPRLDEKNCTDIFCP